MSPSRSASSSARCSASVRAGAGFAKAEPAYSRAGATGAGQAIRGRTGEMNDKITSNAMWGGRFASGPDAVMEAINASIDFDRRLCRRGHRGEPRPCGHAGRHGHRQ